ncbi:MAG TPA: arginine--tRNA ligase [Candidatus Paceibacterota bacterium]|nr:arginine--tRNA ligase [Candidatus Paceibacterota bacterium]
MRDQHDPFIADVAVAGAGFINITLSPAYFQTVLKEAIDEKEQWGSTDMYAGKKILVEHSSPNLFKPFHIGHVMNNAIGESIERMAKRSGATVTAISYPSDISLGISKAIWKLMQDGGLHKLATMHTKEEKIAYLGECYVQGVRMFDESEQVQQEVRSIAKKLYEHIDGPELEAYEEGKKINLAYFKDVVARLGSEFDDFIYESEAGEAGAIIVRENIPNVFEESDGAVIYRGEQDGLHTRVFINTEGYPTYEAKDIGLLSLKFKKFSPDYSLFITDHQQEEYFKVVMAAASKINKEWKDKSIHRTHGRMTFKGQKLSSRLGGVPLATEVLDTIKQEVTTRSNGVTPAVMDEIAIGALKFTILRAMAGKNIDFDPDTSLSFEGDSGPYLQYTAVRAGSVLAKASQGNVEPQITSGEEVTAIERLIAQFPDTVTRSITEWAPHHIVSYLLALAQAFNSWYGTTKIFDENDPLTPHRLAITTAVRQTITNGLWLLGIEVPEKM